MATGWRVVAVWMAAAWVWMANPALAGTITLTTNHSFSVGLSSLVAGTSTNLAGIDGRAGYYAYYDDEGNYYDGWVESIYYSRQGSGSEGVGYSGGWLTQLTASNTTAAAAATLVGVGPDYYYATPMEFFNLVETARNTIRIPFAVPVDGIYRLNFTDNYTYQAELKNGPSEPGLPFHYVRWGSSVTLQPASFLGSWNIFQQDLGDYAPLPDFSTGVVTGSVSLSFPRKFEAGNFFLEVEFRDDQLGSTAHAPVPGSLLLCGSGLMGLLAWGRRQYLG